MLTRSICRRCHRIRFVDWTRLCDPCADVLRSLGQRKVSVPAPLEGEPTVLEPVPGEEPESDEDYGNRGGGGGGG